MGVSRRRHWLAGVLLWCALATPEADAKTASQVSVGNGFACVVTDAGALECFGANGQGRLGDGTTVDRPTPVGVVGLGSGVASVATGLQHACALTTGGAVKCWGHNDTGQLGDGSTTASTVPVAVSGLGSGVQAVSASGSNCTYDSAYRSHSCALTSAGGVKCWGGNRAGQLGDGTTTDRPTPVDVLGLTSGVAAIHAAGCHTCALTTGGGVKCWGKNVTGELGSGTQEDSSTPLDVVGLTSGVTSLAANGDSTTCALTTAGAVKCWGVVPVPGSSGLAVRREPVEMTGASAPVTAIAAGIRPCALLATGAIECFQPTATPKPFLDGGLTSIAAGFVDLCATTTAGELKCDRLGYGPLANYEWSPGCVLGYGDSDGDAICDAGDPCDNAAGGALLASKPRARVVVTRALDGSPGNEELLVSANFALPPGTAFGDVDPSVSGVRGVLLDPDGRIFEVELSPGLYAGPGSKGWMPTPNGKTWRYLDRTMAAATARFTLSDRGKGAPGGLVSTLLRVTSATLPLGASGASRLAAAIVLGDEAAGDAGLCGNRACGGAPAMQCKIR